MNGPKWISVCCWSLSRKHCYKTSTLRKHAKSNVPLLISSIQLWANRPIGNQQQSHVDLKKTPFCVVKRFCLIKEGALTSRRDKKLKPPEFQIRISPGASKTTLTFWKFWLVFTFTSHYHSPDSWRYYYWHSFRFVWSLDIVWST